MVVGEEKMRLARHSGSQDEIFVIDVSLKTSRHGMMHHPYVCATACELIAIESRSTRERMVLVAGASR